MRLVFLFLALVAAALVAVAATVRLIDPVGWYYKPRVVEAALERPSEQCLVSERLIGERASPDFKAELVERRRPRTIVAGTSVVLSLHAWPGEREFTNVGVRNTGVEALRPMFERVHATRREPLTVYVGVSPHWFNASWEAPNRPFGPRPLDQLDYLLARQNLQSSLNVVASTPGSLIEGFARQQVGGRCVLARGPWVGDGEAETWAADGSSVTRWDLVPEVSRGPGDDFARDLVDYESTYYGDWTEFDRDRLAELERALALAKSYGWNVVGFAPSFSRRYVERLSTAPGLRERWREYGELVPAPFRRFGFSFLDLRDVREVPCADHEFDYGNDGWHTDRRCAMRVRHLLDRAAGAPAPGRPASTSIGRPSRKGPD